MNDEKSFSVECTQRGLGWQCAVFVGTVEDGVEHLVTVNRAELARLAPGTWEPTPLVEESFRYLLERESPKSIRRAFAISDIRSYFPTYPQDIVARLRSLGYSDPSELLEAEG